MLCRETFSPSNFSLGVYCNQVELTHPPQFHPALFLRSCCSSFTCIAVDDILWTLRCQRGVQLWRSGRHAYMKAEHLKEYLQQLSESSQRTFAKLNSSTRRKPNGTYVEFDVSCLSWAPPPKSSLPPGKRF
ncbi:hypothetical protein CSKR_108649 [Clonorchis sinensis]|uniref:Uncharacterized protein n=1 Tax=Clonorchis sinensis TaxID=79923 RepID=A0A3R7CBM1_CLOSI|nr:hypothetical protein CSKR_108649 [Clonorchis sinensis]